MPKLGDFQFRVLQGDDPKLRINLKKIFGAEIKSESVRQQLVLDIVDKIVARTEKGKDINGSSFVPYSKAYKKSLDFNAFNKTSKVNLRLTGDMLNSIDAIQTSPTEIEIGFIDEDSKLKASGHIKGSGKLPIRDFFGLTDKEIRELKREYEQDVKIQSSFDPDVIFKAIDALQRGQGG